MDLSNESCIVFMKLQYDSIKCVPKKNNKKTPKYILAHLGSAANYWIYITQVGTCKYHSWRVRGRNGEILSRCHLDCTWDALNYGCMEKNKIKTH